VFAGPYTPTAAELDAPEAALPAYLRAHARASAKAPLADRAPSSLRQYQGVRTPSGERSIFGRFLCRPIEGWRTRMIGVKDGGDCYFSVHYSPDTRQFSGLNINGET
jgi:hypothetical protein